MSYGRWVRVPDEIRNAVRELWAENLSCTDIGRQLGITKNAVVGLVHRMGLPKRPSPIRSRGAGTGLVKLGRPKGQRTSPYSPRFVAPPRKPRPAAALASRAAPPPPPPEPITVRPNCGCQYPLWGMQMPPVHEQRFCGKPVITYEKAPGVLVGRSWCAEHARIVFRGGGAE